MLCYFLLKTMSNFYENIKSIRLSKRLTQAVMSEKLEITEVHYNRIENDKVDISLSKMNKLAEIFGMTLIEILQYGSGVESVKVDNEKVKELEREIDRLQRNLDLTIKELTLEKKKSLKKYNGKFLKVTDKEIELFISNGRYLVNLYSDISKLDEAWAFSGFWLYITEQGIDEIKEHWLLDLFTSLYFKKCFERFFNRHHNYSEMSKEKRNEIFSYCYNSGIFDFFEEFSNHVVIDALIEIGLLDLDGFVEKWKYAISKETFFIMFNEFIILNCSDIKPEEYDSFRFYNYREYFLNG